MFLFCAVAASTWLIVTLSMKTPRYLANLLISIESITEHQADEFIASLIAIPGVDEVRLHFEEGSAYLKVDNQILNKDQLQKLLSQWHGDADKIHH